MKKLLYILLIFPSFLFAQVSQVLNYEAIAYDLNGLSILSQEINVRLSIFKSISSDSSEWIEFHEVVTSYKGLF